MPAESKRTLIKKNNRTFNTNFSQLQVRKKLLQELGEEMAVIMSNAVNLEICPFIKFIWEQHHHLAFAAFLSLIH